jgi:hypothetical protein
VLGGKFKKSFEAQEKRGSLWNKVYPFLTRFMARAMASYRGTFLVIFLAGEGGKK